MGWLELGKMLLGAIPQYFLNKQKEKAVEKERKDKLEELKWTKTFEMAAQGQLNEAEWDNRAAAGAGWKDEYMTIVLSIPMIGCFIPGLDTYILAGFQTLEHTPVWYQAAIAVMIASVFGFRQYANWRMNKLQSGGGK